MARFLNIATLQWREDDGTGLARDGELRNPDLSQVDGVPVKHWKVVDGVVVEMSQQEKDSVVDSELLAAKESRIAAINAKTAALVTAGIEVESGKVISTSIAASQNLQDIAISISLGMPSPFPQKISTLDEGVYEIQDAADFARIASLIKSQKKTIMEAGQDLRLQVLAATTLAEVDAVEDSR